MSTNLVMEILNTAALAGLAYFGYKKYGAPLLKKYITDQLLKREQLRHSYQALLEQQRNIEHEIQYQEQQSLELLVKLGRWRLVAEQEALQRDEEEKRYYQQMQERIAQQQQYQQLHHIEQQVLPQAFEKVRQELRKEFSNEKKSQEYIAKLISNLK